LKKDDDGVRRRDPEPEKGKKRLEGFRQAVASWKGAGSVGRLMHFIFILSICIPFVREFTQCEDSVVRLRPMLPLASSSGPERRKHSVCNSGRFPQRGR